jgi:hypothetical protein
MYHQITSSVTTDNIEKLLCDPLLGTGMVFNILKSEDSKARWFMMNCDAFELPGREDEADQIVIHNMYTNKTEEEKQEVFLYNPLLPKPDQVDTIDPNRDFKFELDDTSDDHLLQFKASTDLGLIEIKKHEIF